jgi:hypothetical protein
LWIFLGPNAPNFTQIPFIFIPKNPRKAEEILRKIPKSFGHQTLLKSIFQILDVNSLFKSKLSLVWFQNPFESLHLNSNQQPKFKKSLFLLILPIQPSRPGPTLIFLSSPSPRSSHDPPPSPDWPALPPSHWATSLTYRPTQERAPTLEIKSVSLKRKHIPLKTATSTRLT